MSDDISEEIRQFIFNYIDSIEQLEVLILLQSKPQDSRSVQEICDELRSSPQSIANRLALLLELKIVQEDPSQPGKYQYKPETHDLAHSVSILCDLYRTRRHRIQELIYSPLKRARSFSNAFSISWSKTAPKKEGSRG